MADVREMKIVGTTAKEVQRQLAGGYQAQGFALAQVIIAATVSTAQNLRRCVETAFDLSTQAREEAIDVLNKWKRDLNENAKANANLKAGGMTDKQAGRIARSAAVRVSEFTTVCKAMDNGFTRETLREKTGTADIDHVGFHTIVELARAFNQSQATGGQGRPADPFEVKLAKWLARQVVSGHDAEVKDKALHALEGILPVEEPKA